MLYVLCAAVLVSYAAGIPMMEMTQARHLQTEVDKGNRPLEQLFQTFKQVHKKVYESELEENVRQGIFKANVEYIKAHNEKYAKGEKSYYLGVNQFTDLTHKEFLSMYTGHLKRTQPSNGTTYMSPYNVNLPETVDWREKNLVTPVKDQKQCGSCWSFSATGSVEGQHAKKTGTLLSLSEQQLVDCSGTYGNQGCNGGLMDQAFEYVKSIKGLETEEDYPYLAKEEDRCEAVTRKEKAKVTGYVDLPAGSEKSLQEAVATIGPISIAIDASHPSFQSYHGGVYNEEECSSSQLDHGVLIVGYGKDSDSGNDYWLVKNSWNTVWGMEGYIMMSRNKDNQCGVASQASYPLV